MVGFSFAEMVSDWVSQTVTYYVAQVHVVLVYFFYLLYIKRRLLIAPLTWSYFLKKQNLQAKGRDLPSSLPSVVLQMLKH